MQIVQENNIFTPKLISWWQVNKRDLPWKSTKDPYKIWLSEIILQQTTIAQGLPYYLKFVKKYPNIHKLAQAKDDNIFKMWEGLGYYNRAKNMLYTARYISNELKGIFPNNHDEILRLKGIGPYTSAAIASFAYELPYPVIDGNVLRFISRYLGLEMPIDEKATYSIIKNFLQDNILIARPSEFNQALMDFGSTMCTPRNPNCNICVFAKDCLALKSNLTAKIPYKSKKIVKKKLHFDYFHIDINSAFTVIQQRDSDDIWPNLFQFPKETMSEESKENLKIFVGNIISSSDFVINNLEVICQLKQTLTHRIIHGNFYKISIETEIPLSYSGFNIVNYSQLELYAFPKIMNEYINKYLKF